MHILCIFWKILFACIPPTEYWNGWACFIVSIFVIGFLTAIIGDLASHFGCTVGLRDSVTAVVFVALGTSLPGKSFNWWVSVFLQEWQYSTPEGTNHWKTNGLNWWTIYCLTLLLFQIPLPVKWLPLRTNMQMHVWEMWQEATLLMCFWALGWPGPWLLCTGRSKVRSSVWTPAHWHSPSHSSPFSHSSLWEC